MGNYFDKKEKQDRDNKPSWRDIDARKSGKDPYSSSNNNKKPNSQQEKRQQSQAKKALDDLFTPKKNPAQTKAWKAVEQAKGREFQTLATQYIEEHGLPKVWDDLLKLLNIEDENILESVLERLESYADDQNTGAKTLACAQLRMAKLNHEDENLHDAIDALINTLS